MTEIVAEIGSNHEGSFDKCAELICSAAECGCDAVKFQIFRPEHLVTADAPAMVGEGTQRERFARLAIDPDQYLVLAQVAEDNGLKAYATFFDVGLIEQYGQHFDAIKIASGDAQNYELIYAAEKTEKPIIISLGLVGDMDIMEMMDNLVLSWSTWERVTFLHCVSQYPCPPELASLDQMLDYRDRCERPIGYSDHCVGTLACEAAAAMGAVMIEKHFTDDWRGRTREPSGYLFQ